MPVPRRLGKGRLRYIEAPCCATQISTLTFKAYRTAPISTETMSIDTSAPLRPRQAPPPRQAADTCRYQESQPRSAELLRLVLAWMGKHDAAFNPVTFAFWYEHAAGLNLRLSQAIEQCLLTEPRLGDATVYRLYREHIVDADEATAEHVSGGFRRVMQGLAESVSRTGDTANSFGEKLGALTHSLGTANELELATQVGDALACAAQMQGSMQALQEQLSTSQSEIEKLRSDLQRSRQEAILCPLTHVLNRNGFDQKLLSVLDMAKQSGKPSCLVMIDIDHFKRVNDNFGHVVGDRMLEGLGEILRMTVTDSGAAVARYGGEEFALLLANCEVARAVELTEAVRQRVKGMRVRQRGTDKVVCTVTVSAGVAAWQAGDDAAALIGRADAALYRAKQAGRDKVLKDPLC